MNEFLIVLAFTALPALGNFAGGILAEFITASDRALSLALHAATGVVIAVISLELIPQSLQVDAPLMTVFSFVAGGLFFVAIDQVTQLVKTRFGSGDVNVGPWMIFLGVAIDLFTDGVMIGTGSTIATELGLLLALGQIPADVPEGLATIIAFKRQGVPRRKRFQIAAAFVIPIFVGATIGYWLMRGQSELVKMALLTFTAGILTTLVVEEIIPEAHQDGEARFATLLFLGGFALFGLLSAFLG
ncbi:ZIP family zinc transporter [filamentous cyanobacterium CCP2]|nr:ZIP family zinc transporter [filamentous cyanobacterium CCP2]